MQQVKMRTNQGTILIQLNSEKAPKTVENFVNYVNSGFYNGTLFHRVIDGFMIQGGGMEPALREKTTNPPIENEATNGLSNVVGSIAMARTPDPHSASSQFFINMAKNTFLDHTAKTSQGWGYCVFGEVVDGMDVVKKIEKVATTSRFGHQDVPVEPVIIENTEVVESD
ncbi:MAG: peptidyl-prolyl cis-trans isomerase [Gammaproteobacteria bacterium]|nr:MAG: peptidyl-prolyl cis-trans isomerase [Gammaproteobacteria bacterium]RKZ40861.1 MAG: peptidyl-prolyl cis-trans isomerase [Gammaproteobacteria bacterium]RKZ74844.1 MAG: peptidyl-prolyl cis-trans isomerase [Gammaproteobacteria bacterium]